MKTAVVFACNEAYVPLAKGLVLSLRESLQGALRAGLVFDLHFIDIGCEPASLDWLRKQEVTPHAFSREEYISLPQSAALPRYADAQLCRPFLPRIVPGYGRYVWVDTDIWVQSRDAVTGFTDALAAANNYMVICPEYHYGYSLHRNLSSAVNASHGWYSALYDTATADRLCGKPILNSGFFACNGGSPLWARWAEAVAEVYAKEYGADKNVLHFAEQLCLNRVLYDSGMLLLLDPVHNYACGASAALRDARDKMVIGHPPYAPIKGVHLLAFSRYGKDYLQRGFLYQRGAYLSPEELASLKRLVR